MKKHIEQFPLYLQKGYEIAKNQDLSKFKNTFSNIICIWMWWSSMASELIKSLVERSQNSYPVELVQDYQVPNRVSSKTLMIVCSYSGNTEETVTAMKDWLQKGAQMIAITSWWALYDYAHEKNKTLIQMPKGIEPRAALPYSFAIQLCIAEKLGIINVSVQETINHLFSYTKNHDSIRQQAKLLAKELYNTIPIVYATPNFKGVAIRFRQQLNENSRMLCRHHIIPEMNHNELLWRQEWNDQVKVVFLSDPQERPINKVRYELTKKILSERNVKYFDITMKWDTIAKKMLTTIYYVDRISYYTALERKVNPDWMEIIEQLKNELKKHSEPRL